MLTTRRGFFGSLAGLAAGMALDPERALWIPGRKAYSIPRVISLRATEEELATIYRAFRLIGSIPLYEAPMRSEISSALHILRRTREQWRRHLTYLSRPDVSAICLAGELACQYAKVDEKTVRRWALPQPLTQYLNRYAC